MIPYMRKWTNRVRGDELPRHVAANKSIRLPVGVMRIFVRDKRRKERAVYSRAWRRQVYVVAVGTFDVGHAASWRTGGCVCRAWIGDACACQGGGIREKQCGQRNGNSREGRREQEMARDGKKGEAIREMWNQRNRKREKRNIKVRLAGAREEGEAEGMGRGMGKGAISRAGEEKESRRKKNGSRKLKWRRIKAIGWKSNGTSDGWISVNEWDNDDWLWWRCVVISERVIGSEKLLLHLSCVPRYEWLFMITFCKIDRFKY